MRDKSKKTSDIPDLDVCLACKAYHGRVPGLEVLFVTGVLRIKYPNYPEKVLLSALDRAERHGLIEYGVSLRTAWITKAGEKLIAESK